jgi:hypothetical protein
MATSSVDVLPSSQSSELCLAHPTSDELITIWMNTAAVWSDALSLPAYLEESHLLMTAPLAKNGGMTNWILVDKNLAPDRRQILSSCESFRKEAMTSDAVGVVIETIVHGIASVFCPMEYRGRGYPKRMMQELAKTLCTWQIADQQCIGSILYSDIGRGYYAKLGWKDNPSNTHIELRPLSCMKSSSVRFVLATDLPDLCKRDEALLRVLMATHMQEARRPLIIIPDLAHLGWHLAKEDFACSHLFGKVPEVKGAIAGPHGSQVWAIWTRRYYNHPATEKSQNVLYILRLVMEADQTATRLRHTVNEEKYHEQLCHLQAVLQAAQTEAHEWKLNKIQLWNPSPLVLNMLNQIDIGHKVVMREEEGVACGLWYDKQDEISEVVPLWVNTEYYAWC